MTETAPGAAAKTRGPTLETLFVATFALLGLRLGLRPLGDNSLFWHLRTGIDMVHSGHIPRTDPYSFTAAGEPWVVQSWLAEATYGVAERIGGLHAVRIEHGLLYAVIAGLMARLCRAGLPLRTALAAVLSVGLSVVYWSPRPLAFGLLGLVLTATIVLSGRRQWLLVPVTWVWVNTHGSFVLGAVWIVLLLAGRWLDGRRRPDLAPLGWFVVGLVAATVNPLGPRLLAFPLTLLDKREAFGHVVEWRPPSFRSPVGVLTLLCLLGVVAVVATCWRRLGWAERLPLAGFVLLGLTAQRNLPMAAIVAAPVLGRALAPSTARRPDREAADRRSIHTPIAALLGALAALFLIVAASEPALNLEGYPVRAAKLLPAGAKVATSDVAAGYLILTRQRPRGERPVRVLIDDRVDLYPVQLTLDYLHLVDGDRASLAILDRYRADAVLWPAGKPLVAKLAASGRWRRVGQRDGWAVFVRV